MYILATGKWRLKAVLFILTFISFCLESRATGDSISAFILAQAERHLKEGNLRQAFAEFSELQTISIKNEEHKSIGFLSNKLGMIQDRLGQSEKARSLLHHSLSNASIVNDSSTIADAYNNLGASFYHTKDLDSSYYYFSEAIAVFKDIKEFKKLSQVELNFGSLLTEQGNLNQAIIHFKECIISNKIVDDSIVSIVAPMNLGIAFLNLGESDSAILYLNQGVKLAKQYNYP
ncbi:MAG: tetratricopeptide repeat protein, partial [Flavobacteriales bacterium]